MLIYVKEGLHNKRRYDLEIRILENLWIELANNPKRILFSLFYRPPNSDASYYLDLLSSIALAFDKDISNTIITGDFNLIVLSPLSARKIDINQ